MAHYVVLGCGRQGIAVSYFLARYGNAEKITLVDKNISQRDYAVKKVKNLIRGSLTNIDFKILSNFKMGLRPILRSADVLIAALPHEYVFEVAQEAAVTGTHYCDYGFSTEIIKKQLALDKQAKKSGAALIFNNGIGPGLNNIVAVGGSNEFDCDTIKMFIGEIPENPNCNALGYEASFANLLDEYVGESTIIENGKLKKIALPAGFEKFKVPFAKYDLEAFFTDVGTSITAELLLSKGKIKNFWEKTVRWPGHYKFIRQLDCLGLFKKEETQIGKISIAPFDVSKHCFESLPRAKKDIVIFVIIFEKNGKKIATIHSTIGHNPAIGLTAIQRATSSVVALTAKMLADGKIPPGAHLPEIIINEIIGWRTFIAELRKIGILLNINMAPR